MTKINRFRSAIATARQSRNQAKKNGIHRRGTEYRSFNFQQFPLRVLGASALKVVADPSFGGSVVNIFLSWKSKNYSDRAADHSIRRVTAGGGLISLTKGIGSSSIFTGSILTAELPVRPSIQ
jgi:hypothetical protein